MCAYEGSFQLTLSDIFTILRTILFWLDIFITTMRTHTRLRAASVLSLAVVIVLCGAYPQKLSAQGWCSSHLYSQSLWLPIDMYFGAPLSDVSAMLTPHNSPVRLGVIGALAINVHDAQFNVMQFYSRNIYSNQSSSDMVSAITNTMGSSLGISLEVPVAERFAIGVRFIQASHSTSFRVAKNSSMNVNILTVGIEAFSVFNFDENWRGYAGFSIAGLREGKYSFSTDIAGSPATDLPQTTLAVFSPLIGFGYDILLTEDPIPGKGRWILTPELIGMMGTNQIMTALSANEHWLISQVRLGFSLKYDWPSGTMFSQPAAPSTFSPARP